MSTISPKPSGIPPNPLKHFDELQRKTDSKYKSDAQGSNASLVRTPLAVSQAVGPSNSHSISDSASSEATAHHTATPKNVPPASAESTEEPDKAFKTDQNVVNTRVAVSQALVPFEAHSIAEPEYGEHGRRDVTTIEIDPFSSSEPTKWSKKISKPKRKTLHGKQKVPKGIKTFGKISGLGILGLGSAAATGALLGTSVAQLVQLILGAKAAARVQAEEGAFETQPLEAEAESLQENLEGVLQSAAGCDQVLKAEAANGQALPSFLTDGGAEAIGVEDFACKSPEAAKAAEEILERFDRTTDGMHPDGSSLPGTLHAIKGEAQERLAAFSASLPAAQQISFLNSINEHSALALRQAFAANESTLSSSETLGLQPAWSMVSMLNGVQEGAKSFDDSAQKLSRADAQMPHGLSLSEGAGLGAGISVGAAMSMFGVRGLLTGARKKASAQSQESQIDAHLAQLFNHLSKLSYSAQILPQINSPRDPISANRQLAINQPALRALEYHSTGEALEVHDPSKKALEVYDPNKKALEGHYPHGYLHKRAEGTRETVIAEGQPALRSLEYRPNSKALEVYDLNEKALEVYDPNKQALEVYDPNKQALEVYDPNKQALEVYDPNKQALEVYDPNKQALEGHYPHGYLHKRAEETQNTVTAEGQPALRSLEYHPNGEAPEVYDPNKKALEGHYPHGYLHKRVEGTQNTVTAEGTRDTVQGGKPIMVEQAVQTDMQSADLDEVLKNHQGGILSARVSGSGAKSNQGKLHKD